MRTATFQLLEFIGSLAYSLRCLSCRNPCQTRHSLTLNSLSCRKPHQTRHSLNPPPSPLKNPFYLFHWKLGIRLPLTGAEIPKIGKRGFRSQKNPISRQKRVFRVKNIPFLYRALQGKWGFFDSEDPFLAGNGGFLTPKPSFPDFGRIPKLKGAWSHPRFKKRPLLDLIVWGWRAMENGLKAKMGEESYWPSARYPPISCNTFSR